MLSESPRFFEKVLLVLFFVALGVLVVFILIQKGILGRTATTSTPNTTVVNVKEINPETEAAKPPTPTITSGQADKELRAIIDALNKGTITQEEAIKQMNAVSAKAPLPTAPANISQ